MSKMLSLENMLVAAHNSNMPGAQEFAKDACLLASELGQKLAAHLCVDGPVICDFDPTEMSAEVLGGFAPRWKDQPLPAVLREFDSDGDWEERARPYALAPEVLYARTVMQSNAMVSAVLANAHTGLERLPNESIQAYLMRSLQEDFESGAEGCLFPSVYAEVVGASPGRVVERQR